MEEEERTCSEEAWEQKKKVKEVGRRDRQRWEIEGLSMSGENS